MFPAIIIFIQNPDKGKVKPNLATELGEDTALSIHNQLLTHIRTITEPIPAEKYLYYSDYPNWNDAWPISTYRKRLQQGSNPSETFHIALESVFEEDHNKAVLITADTPELTTQHITKAFESLDDHEVVLGPTASGGHYLLGMKTLQPDLFTNIDWSTKDALAEAVAALRLSGISYYLLPTLHTINTPADLALSGLTYQ